MFCSNTSSISSFRTGEWTLPKYPIEHGAKVNILNISPLEQFSNPFLYLPIPLINLGISKITFYGILIVIVTLAFYTFPFVVNSSIIGTRWTVTAETLYTSTSSILKDQLGIGFSEYIPATVTIFAFILFANLISNIPYSFGFNTSVIICLSMSIIVFIGVTIIGITTHKIHWFSFFVPSGSPLALVPVLVLIEFVSYIARAFSLGIRLAANLISGHILLAVISSMIWTILTSGIVYFVLGLIPYVIFTGLFGLEIAVSVIQSYVFTLLFCSYLNDAINLH
jgi:F-type H+-transporting ATPase subunit a